MSYKKGDVAVITSPPRLAEEPEGTVYFDEGDVLDIVQGTDEDGDVFAVRRSDGKPQLIAAACLTPFSKIADDPNIEWVDGIHDYVHEEGNDE